MTREDSHLLLFSALEAELTPVIRRLGLTYDKAKKMYVGKAGTSGVEIHALSCGMGKIGVASAFVRFVEMGNPELVVWVGFAGATNDTLESGDLAPTKWLVNEAGHVMSFEQGEVPELAGAVKREPADSLLTIERLASTPAQKQKLGRGHRAAAVDMESFHLAKKCAERRVPLRIIRVISDPAEIVVPSQAVNWIGGGGKTRTMRAAWDYLRDGKVREQVNKLKPHVKVAEQRLADEVHRTMQKHQKHGSAS